ncbi:hypothetical protein M378DRAFT_86425 [Amanita muscaria Koide BX008]|uniref:DUF7918 domain-containing protein n=1 Tax=Amanita muscaria (strain Koide BX008) TaxID=946122 RepID=A0A0C2S705_AMAMK|nr:hypothetical protein M378DRAFT_86425 [Amanita muscaria Koide BX008]
MPTFGTINAYIKVDGTILPEYGVQTNEAEREVTCWIPSEVGKSFSVSWDHDTTNLSTDTAGYLVLDGRSVGGEITRKGSAKRPELASEYISPTTCRDFSFAPIKYTDDDGYLDVPTPDVGYIQLTVWRIELGKIDTHRKLNDAPNATLHERSKKLGAHCVHFGEVRNITPTTFYNTEKIEVLARFVFRYRPIDMLRANGIAPPLPRQEPVRSASQGRKRKDLDTSEEIEIKDDPDEDIEERVARLKVKLLFLGEFSL